MATDAARNGPVRIRWGLLIVIIAFVALGTLCGLMYRTVAVSRQGAYARLAALQAQYPAGWGGSVRFRFQPMANPRMTWEIDYTYPDPQTPGNVTAYREWLPVFSKTAANQPVQPAGTPGGTSD